MSGNLDNQTEHVRLLATAFRKAIERALEAGELRHTVIASFPIGCCGYTSDLLQRYLRENDIKTRYASGVYRDCSTGDSQSHAWLELNDGTVVDITGDQFRYKPQPLQNDRSVYCGKPNDFYDLFELDPPCQCEGTYSLDIVRKEKLAYGIICKYL